MARSVLQSCVAGGGTQNPKPCVQVQAAPRRDENEAPNEYACPITMDMQGSQGQIMAVAFRQNSINPDRIRNRESSPGVE